MTLIFKLTKGPKDGFVMISNKTLADDRLDIGAKGLLSFLLTHAKNFQLNYKYVYKNAGGSQTVIDKGLQRLREAGYVHIKQIRESGRFKDWQWLVYETSREPDPLARKLAESRQRRLQRKRKNSEPAPEK